MFYKYKQNVFIGDLTVTEFHKKLYTKGKRNLDTSGVNLLHVYGFGVSLNYM